MNRQNTLGNNSLVALILVFAPVLSNYKFIAQFSLGDVCVLFTLPWLFHKIKFNHFSVITFFLATFIVATSFILLGGSEVYGGFYRAACYYLLFFIVTSSVDFEFTNFIKIYGYACLVASATIIIQWVAYFGLGTTLIFQLPLEHYEPDTLHVIDHAFRAGGIFKEPSYFSIYVMPYFVYTASQRKFSIFVFICIAGIMSTSSLMFFLILVSLFILSRKIFNKQFAIGIFLFVLFFIPTLLVNLSDEFIFIDRINSIFVDGGTLNDRFLPFFEIFDAANTILPSSRNLTFFRSADLWFNSAASLVVYFGSTGLLLLLSNLHKFGFLFGAFFLLCIFSTHFMSGPFGYFVAIGFMILRTQVYSPFRPNNKEENASTSHAPELCSGISKSPLR